MQPLRKVTGFLVAAAVTGLGIGLAAPSQAASPPGTFDGIVSTVPAETPDFSNGTVFAVAQVGDTVVVGGSFTAASDGNGAFTQNALVAYSLSSGQIIRTWKPAVVGTVSALVPGVNGTVYVAGALTSVNGKGGKLALLDARTGASVSTFKPPAFNGKVNDLALGASKLYVGGAFTKAGTAARGGLAALDPASGALDASMTIALTGHHNYGTVAGASQGATGAENVALNKAGTRLIVDGNFRTVTDSVQAYARDQIVSIDLTGAAPAVDRNWNTNVYTAPCNKKYDSYVRDIAWSPDDSYFVVVSTGGYGSVAPSGTWCDAAARFDAGSSGQAVLPRWTDRTGGDSLYGVAVTDDAVYVGGHQRWLNNDAGKDRAAAGAVPRPGLGALDPRSGVPLAWNAARNPRGDGAQVVYAGPSGLFVGSDTDYIGNYRYQRGKLAYLPLAGGGVPAAENPGNPTKIYIGGNSGNSFASRTFDPATGLGGPSMPEAAGAAVPWSSVRGAFMLDGRVWYGMTDGTLRVQDFDGTTFGQSYSVDPYLDSAWAAVPSGSKTSAGDPIPYAGVKNQLYFSISGLTGLVYSDGFVYYSKSGNAGLFRRSFSSATAPDAGRPGTLVGGVLGAVETQVASTGFSGISGMFLAGGKLFVGWSDGKLRSVPFVNGAPVGTPQPIPGASYGWRGKALFTAP